LFAVRAHDPGRIRGVEQLVDAEKMSGQWGWRLSAGDRKGLGVSGCPGKVRAVRSGGGTGAEMAEAGSVQQADAGKEVELALIALVDLFDSGEIEGGESAFESAREVLERRGRMTFGAWMARVMSEMAVDEVDSDGFRCFYDKGMSPSEAVLADRMEAGVLET